MCRTTFHFNRPSTPQKLLKTAKVNFLGIAGVDIMTDDITTDSTENSYIIEVNLTPGIRMHQFPSIGKPIDVANIIFSAIEHTARPIGKELTHIGKAELISLPDFSTIDIPARIDTGATLSSIWASDIMETPQGLSFVLFDKTSELYSGKKILIPDYDKHAVSSSMGQTQVRYKVKMTVVVKGRKIKASFTLADRSTQVYPVLIGRNIIRGKFIVDVSVGTKKLTAKEKLKRAELDSLL